LKRYLAYFLMLLLTGGCITQFVPETEETQISLVVEGLITDQHEVNTIKLSRSLPLGSRITAKPVSGCEVILSDDQGNSWKLREHGAGIYITDTAEFRGIVGRKYKLTVHANSDLNFYSYESLPMEMKPVPPIDSIYYEKVTIRERTLYRGPAEGCQIYLDARDPEGKCDYFRWDYTETWKIQLPFVMPLNKICWVTENSTAINIKNTSLLASTRIVKYPIRLITNQTDRLTNRYSLLVTQYSLDEEEFKYWDKLRSITEDVGSLYDIIPASINSNIHCIEDPGEKVLGYFSVSAKSMKRIFIEQFFAGLVNPYVSCVTDTVYNNDPIPNLNTSKWILDASPFRVIPSWVTVTDYKGCADCTVRGTKIKPDFWVEDK